MMRQSNDNQSYTLPLPIMARVSDNLGVLTLPVDPKLCENPPEVVSAEPPPADTALGTAPAVHVVESVLDHINNLSLLSRELTYSVRPHT